MQVVKAKQQPLDICKSVLLEKKQNTVTVAAIHERGWQPFQQEQVFISVSQRCWHC